MLRKLGLGTLVLGSIAFCGSLLWAFIASSREAKDLDRDVRSLRAELSRARDELPSLERDVAAAQRRVDAARLDENGAQAEMQRAIDSEPRLAAESGDSLQSLKSRTAELEAEISALRRASMTETLAPPPPEPPRKETAADGNATRAAVMSIDERLQRFRDAIALVVSEGSRIATGLVVGYRMDKVYVLCVAEAVRAGGAVACLFRSAGKPGEEFQLVPSEVVLRKTGSPFILLEGTVPQSSAFTELSETDFEGAEPKKGATVYSVGAHAVGVSAFTGSVFEGLISSIEDSPDGGHRVLRTTLPANEGAEGSVVVDGDAKVVGILWQGSAGLSRASTVMPASAAKPVIERLRKHTMGMPGSDPAVAGQGTSRDFKQEASIPLADRMNADVEMFPGPDDLVLLWNRSAGTIAAFRAGSSTPAWEVTRGPWTGITYRPWLPYAFLSNSKTWTTVVLNLRNGSLGARLPQALSQYFSYAWAAIPLGKSHVIALPQGIVSVNLESGRAISLPGFKATLMANAEGLLTLTTGTGDVGWFSRDEFLAITTRIDGIQGEIERLQREKKSPSIAKYSEIRKKEQQISVLVGQLTGGVKLFTVPGGLRLDATHPGTSFSYVPGSYLHIVGRSVWQIGPDRPIRIGRLEPLWHETSSAIGGSMSGVERAQESATSSPDGRYAVTRTHLYDLKELKAVAELPFSAWPTGFTSKGKLIYAYDGSRGRLVLLSLDEILRGSDAPASGKERARGSEDQRGR
jgi:hypothetical protein